MHTSEYIQGPISDGKLMKCWVSIVIVDLALQKEAPRWKVIKTKIIIISGPAGRALIYL